MISSGWEISERWLAIAYGGDVAEVAGAEGIVGAAIENFRRLDIVVNKSGMSRSTPLGSITEHGRVCRKQGSRREHHKGFQ